MHHAAQYASWQCHSAGSPASSSMAGITCRLRPHYCFLCTSLHLLPEWKQQIPIHHTKSTQNKDRFFLWRQSFALACFYQIDNVRGWEGPVWGSTSGEVMGEGIEEQHFALRGTRGSVREYVKHGRLEGWTETTEWRARWVIVWRACAPVGRVCVLIIRTSTPFVAVIIACAQNPWRHVTVASPENVRVTLSNFVS